MVAMVARARADMWQLVKELLNYFYLTNLWAKIWFLCVFFMLQGCCCFYFWRQPYAPTSKQNGENFENRVENWYPNY